MLYANEYLGGIWFKDCFIGEENTFDKDFDFLRKPYGEADKGILVFYPHGNLVLATNFYDHERKICSRKEEGSHLLDSIIKRWTFEDSTPLFVSEGDSSQKLKAVKRSSYLEHVYDNVMCSDLGTNICVYGWSMSDQDDHLLSAIGWNEPDSLAISVFTSDPNWEESCEKIRDKLGRFEGFRNWRRDTDIIFYDSNSLDCWVNSEPLKKNEVQAIESL